MNGEQDIRYRVFSSERTLSRIAAEFFAALSREAIASHDRFDVALSGGTTPIGLYRLLATERFEGSIRWRKVQIFWVDERCVPKEHADSNFRLAYDTLLSKVPLPEKNIHRIRGEEGPEQAALDYESDLRNFFGAAAAPSFDLVILGAGEDGHAASLFPGAPALQETKRLAAPVHREKPEQDRVTLTLPALNNAAYVLCLVSGGHKADMVYEVLGRGNRKRFPAGLVRPVNGILQWFIDEAAAQKLT